VGLFTRPVRSLSFSPSLGFTEHSYERCGLSVLLVIRLGQHLAFFFPLFFGRFFFSLFCKIPPQVFNAELYTRSPLRVVFFFFTDFWMVWACARISHFFFSPLIRESLFSLAFLAIPAARCCFRTQGFGPAQPFVRYFLSRLFPALVGTALCSFAFPTSCHPAPCVPLSFSGPPEVASLGGTPQKHRLPLGVSRFQSRPGFLFYCAGWKAFVVVGNTVSFAPPPLFTRVMLVIPLPPAPCVGDSSVKGEGSVHRPP